MVNHERRPGIGMLAGWRGEGGTESGRGAPNPDQLARYAENDCVWREPLPDNARYFRHVNLEYLEYAVSRGFLDAAEPMIPQLYSEVLQRFRLAGEGHGGAPAARGVARAYRHCLRSASRLVSALGGRRRRQRWFSAARDHPTSDGHVPLVGIRRTRGSARFTARTGFTCMRLRRGRMVSKDDGWVWVISPHGRVKAQVRTMEGVNPDTVWTWNAIGKRSGAWNLDPAAPEATKGFLLNHLISDVLPAGDAGGLVANADPVTGQAAWYDVRVRIEKVAADEVGEAAPRFATLKVPTGLPPRPGHLAYGAEFRGIGAPRP